MLHNTPSQSEIQNMNSYSQRELCSTLDEMFLSQTAKRVVNIIVNYRYQKSTGGKNSQEIKEYNRENKTLTEIFSRWQKNEVLSTYERDFFLSFMKQADTYEKIAHLLERIQIIISKENKKFISTLSDDKNIVDPQLLGEQFQTTFCEYKNILPLNFPLQKITEIGNFDIYQSQQSDGYHYYSIKKNTSPLRQLETPIVFLKPLDFLESGVIFGRDLSTGHILSFNPEGFFESVFSDEELVNLSHVGENFYVSKVKDSFHISLENPDKNIENKPEIYRQNLYQIQGKSVIKINFSSQKDPIDLIVCENIILAKFLENKELFAKFFIINKNEQNETFLTSAGKVDEKMFTNYKTLLPETLWKADQLEVKGDFIYLHTQDTTLYADKLTFYKKDKTHISHVFPRGYDPYLHGNITDGIFAGEEGNISYFDKETSTVKDIFERNLFRKNITDDKIIEIENKRITEQGRNPEYNQIYIFENQKLYGLKSNCHYKNSIITQKKIFGSNAGVNFENLRDYLKHSSVEKLGFFEEIDIPL